MKTDIGETICEAVELIVNKKLEDLVFDKTIICTITNDKDKQSGYYEVENKDTKFKAYSEKTEYKVGDQVCVLIPDGDFSASQKTIISKYNVDYEESTSTFYSPPFSKLILMGSNLLPPIGENGIKINDGKEPLAICDIQLPHDQNSLNFTDLGIRASFKSLLQDHGAITKGTFGIAIQVMGSNLDQCKNYTFSDEDMFGNPFGYAAYSVQEKKINITNLDFKIEHIKIAFYQDNNFESFGEKIPVSSSETFDLYVKDIELYYANDLTIKEKDSFEIYTENTQYDIVEDNERNLYTIWYHMDNGGRYLGLPEDPSAYTISWYYLSQGSWIPLEIDNDKIYPRKDVKEERIKAILFYEDKKYESNILVFNNLSFFEQSAEGPKVGALTITLGEKAESSYPFYGQDNSLIKPSQGTINRKLNLEFSPFKSGLIPKLFFENATSIVWFIPIGNITMLNFDKNFLLTDFTIEESFDKTQMVFTQKDKTKAPYFAFQIKDTYSAVATKNTIRCEVVYQSLTYTADFTFSFSANEKSGIDYTLTIVQDKSNLSVVLQDPESIAITLTDENVSWYYLDTKDQWQILKEHSLAVSYLWNNDLPNIIKTIVEKENIYLEKTYSVNKIEEEKEPPKPEEEPPISFYALAPDKVVYNKQGTNPTYYKGELKLFDSNDRQILTRADAHLKKGNPEDKIIWRLKYFVEGSIIQPPPFRPWKPIPGMPPRPMPRNKDYANSTPGKIAAYMTPKVIEKEGQYLFKAPFIYVERPFPITLIACFGEGKNEEIVWEQPVLIELESSNKTDNTEMSTGDIISNVVGGRIPFPIDKHHPPLDEGFAQIPESRPYSGMFLGDKNGTFGLYSYKNGKINFQSDIDGHFSIGNNKEIDSDGDNIKVGPLQVYKEGIGIQNYFSVNHRGEVYSWNGNIVNLYVTNLNIKDPTSNNYLPMKLFTYNDIDFTAEETEIPCKVEGENFQSSGKNVTVTIPTYKFEIKTSYMVPGAEKK